MKFIIENLTIHKARILLDFIILSRGSRYLLSITRRSNNNYCVVYVDQDPNALPWSEENV